MTVRRCTYGCTTNDDTTRACQTHGAPWQLNSLRQFLVEWFTANGHDGYGYISDHSTYIEPSFRDGLVTLDGQWDFDALAKAIEERQT